MAEAIYRGVNSNRGRSPELWAKCNISDMIISHNGLLVGDDFTDIFASTNRYVLTESDDNAAIGLLATEVGGVLRLAIASDDNEECNLISGGNEAGFCKFYNPSSEAVKRLWFETRIRVSSIVADVCGITVGLCQEGAGGADLQTDDTGAVKDMDHVSFRTEHTNGGTTVNATLDAVYRTSAGSEADAVSGLKTLVAATWYKVGLYCDENGLVHYYVDGVENATTHLTSVSGFPDGEELAFYAGAKVGSNAALNFDIDWWYAGMEW